VSDVTQIRIGVVGLGLIGQVVHLPNLARLSRSFRVTHVSDLSATLMASIAGSLPGPPKTSVDARDLFADPDVDAVLLLTPGAHAPLAAAALAAGKHVISEKPMCVTQAEADELQRLADERGLVLQVAYMKAYDPSIAGARDALEQIGPAQLVSVEVRHPSHELQIAALDVETHRDVDMAVIRAAETAESASVHAAIGDAPAGLAQVYQGVLLGSVVHELAALRALGFQPPSRWLDVRAWPFDPARASEDAPSLAATAELDGGAVLRLQWLYLPEYPRYEETITVVGSNGAVQLDMPQPYGPNVPATLNVRRSDGSAVQIDDGRHRRDSGFLEELQVFHTAVTSGGPNATDAATARDDTASLQQLTATLAAGYGIQLGGEAGRPGR
jgi:predicted dehydrogenase